MTMTQATRRGFLAAGAAAAILRGPPARAATEDLRFADWPGPSLDLSLALPPAITPETRLVFVMHGVARGGRGVRDYWLQESERRRLIVAAPSFDTARFPGAAGYQLGDLGGPDASSHAAIEPIFDALRARFGLRAATYDIYGHSAGAQFLHRFLFRRPDARIRGAVAANAGWWLRPIPEVPYPYGLRNGPYPLADVLAAFTRPLTVLLGVDDRRRDGSLRQTPEAEAQGPHRVARGAAFFIAAERLAARNGAPFNWRLGYVDGVGHSSRKMTPHAARILFR